MLQLQQSGEIECLHHHMDSLHYGDTTEMNGGECSHSEASRVHTCLSSHS